MQENVYLVGLPGSGKTTVGRCLAKLLQLEFIDTDLLIEARTGVTISHIFEIEGESGFRQRESRLFEEVSVGPQSVISTGGGAILSADNRKIMRDNGQVVYLKASINILWKRLKGCQNRPLLQSPDPKAKVSELLRQREPLYQSTADIIVEVTSDSANKTAQKIVQLISAV